MKLATGILILGIGLGTATAQNPSVIDTTKAKLVSAQQQKTADINAALGTSQGQSVAPQSSAAKPAAGKASSTSQAQAATAPATAPKPAAKAVAAEDHGEENYQGCRRPAQGAKTGGSGRRQEESG